MTVDNKGANISLKPVDPEKLLTLQVNIENKKDLDKFGEFAEELKTAAKTTSRDSSEYKEIISMLEGFNKKGVDFSNTSSKVAADWRKLHRMRLRMYDAATAYYRYTKTEVSVGGCSLRHS